MNIKSHKWSARFLKLALEISSWSKDTSTKVGAVIMDKNGEPVSWGYNGMPPGVDDTIAERMERPVKYCYMEHAERNAIYQASKKMNKGHIFITHPPCTDCARGIIKKKLKRVIVDGANGINSEFGARYADSFKHTMIMFEEAGVEYVEIDLTQDYENDENN